MKQNMLPGVGTPEFASRQPSETITTLDRHYSVHIRTEPGMDSDIDQQFAMDRMLADAGATNLKGGYNEKLAAWMFTFDLAFDLAPTAGQFTRLLADLWRTAFFQEHNPLYVSLGLDWVDEGGAIRYSVALDTLDLSRLHYEQR